ncbi:hypothetical protein Lal_00032558 [Lupinus albus]|uniref:Uncharacterized protein n=1 Tax=Lupinus albus TaxID=3870 RepID=A0A6A4R8B4_LUPAL|nr:hypothetical protein Lalb_Chr01g0022451 [Lupinus albus]KAF1897798.1 hypothetical protein Lal_00032558 [Lupinus albus]
MQIFQWLFRGLHAQERESKTFHNPSSKSEDIRDQNGKGKDISLLKHHRAYQRSKRKEWSKLRSKNSNIFAFIYIKNIPKECFYSTINLKRLRSFNKRNFVHSMKMKREEARIANKAESIVHVGNKVLPISEAPLSSLVESNDKYDTKENKGKKTKPISRMKELIRWVASAKTEKGDKFNGRKVLMFRRRGTLKAFPNDDQVCGESPKISFSYSTISIASSSQSEQTLNHKQGNWITTDSEFVVLEL